MPGSPPRLYSFTTSTTTITPVISSKSIARIPPITPPITAPLLVPDDTLGVGVGITVTDATTAVVLHDGVELGFNIILILFPLPVSQSESFIIKIFTMFIS